MTTIEPFSVGFEPSNGGDAMEEDRPAAEDDLDIDLDLTSDPAPNIIDDEMIEDPELNEEVEAGIDEQMIDDMDQAEEDGISDHDEYLGDVDFADPTDDPDLVIDDTEDFPPHKDERSDSFSQGAVVEGFCGQDNSQHPTENQGSSIQLPKSDEGKVVGSCDSAPQQFGIQESAAASPQVGQHITRHAGDSWEESYSPTQNHEGELIVQPSEIDSTALMSQNLGQEASISASAQQSQIERSKAKPAQATNTYAEKTEHLNIQTPVGSGDTLEHDGLISNYPGVPSDDVVGANDHLQSFEEQSAAPPLLEETQEVNSQAPEAIHSEASPVTQDAEEESASHESPYVHPVLIVYQGSEMFLFPPAEEDQEEDQTYLISEEAFAGETIEILLKECRKVLQDSIGDQEELQIVIHDLDLVICESTVEATKTTLFDVLEVFQGLYRVDSDDDPPPMSMALSTKSRFSRRLEYLIGCASEGIGLSCVKKDHPPSNVVTRGTDETRDRASDNDKAANKEEVSGDTTTSKHVPSDENLEIGIKAREHFPTDTISSQAMQNPVTNRATTKNPSDIGVNLLPAGTGVTVNDPAIMTQNDSSSTNVSQSADDLGALAATSDELAGVQEEDNERSGEDELKNNEGVEAAEHEDENIDKEGVVPDPHMFLENQESASSSTVQGDEVAEAKDDFPHLDQEKVADSRIGPDYYLSVSNPDEQYDDEDFISYDPDEEEDPSYTDPPGMNLPQEDIDELDAEESGTGNLTTVSPAASRETFSRQSSAPTADQNDTAPHQYASNNTDGVNGRNGSQNGLQDGDFEPRDFDDIQVEGRVSSQHVLSADDEDEITLDDDVEEELSTKHSEVDSSSITNRTANGSSPGSLKRARNDYSDQNQIDSKRIRSG
ncbi:MAG: hypothetical protein Q9174_000720 [Haloplaca sp. 1 TL-2023]